MPAEMERAFLYSCFYSECKRLDTSPPGEGQAFRRENRDVRGEERL